MIDPAQWVEWRDRAGQSVRYRTQMRSAQAVKRGPWGSKCRRTIGPRRCWARLIMRAFASRRSMSGGSEWYCAELWVTTDRVVGDDGLRALRLRAGVSRQWALRRGPDGWCVRAQVQWFRCVVRRFDRDGEGARIPYLSGGTLLQCRRDEDRAYTELADAIRRIGAAPADDLRELWRRLVINFLITNVDDHLWNVGFLYAGDGKWRLAPAFDVNPFPDRARESKTWLSEASGPITSLEQLLSEAPYFGLTRAEAEELLGTVALKLAQWREIAGARDVGLTDADIAQFAPAFEHDDARAARALVH